MAGSVAGRHAPPGTVDAYDYLVWALTRSMSHPDNRGLVAADLTPAAYKSVVESSA